jgi:hypothetical protein
MTQELRKLADDLLFTGRYGNESEEQASKRRVARNKEASIAILALLDRLEKADALVKAIKTDRHDWEDWPDDSREAFRAMEASK